MKKSILLFLLAIFFCFPLKGTDFTFRLCHIPDNPWQTKLLIVNPGTGNITAQFHHISENGSETVGETIVLLPGQSAEQTPEKIGSGGNGWLECTGDTAPAVVLSYEYGDSESVCRFTLSPDKTGTKWLLPLPTEGPQDWYGIAAANFGDETVQLTVSGILNSELIEQVTISVDKGQKTVDTLSHLFRELNYRRPDWLLLTATTAIPAPIGIAGNNSQDRHLFFSAEPLVPGGEDQARYIVSHIAESNWESTVELINPDDTASRNAAAFLPSGQALSDTGLRPFETASVDLAGSGNPGPLIINSRTPVAARLQYRYKNSPSICSFFLHNRWSRKWILPDTEENWLDWHGIAIGNPLSTPVEVSVTAYNADGPAANATRTVETGGKWVGLAREWFSENKKDAPDLSEVVYFRIESDIQLPAPILIAGNNAQDRHVFLQGIPVDSPDVFVKNGPAFGVYWPTGGWRECRPEEAGMDSGKLREARDYAANPAINTQGLLVIRNGYIVAEQYFQGNTENTIRHSFSIAKSFTSCLTGIALDKGRIAGLDTPVYTFFPQWQQPDTPAIKKRITLRQLLTMTSGISWNQDAPDYDLDMMILSGDYVSYVLNKPVIHEPGTYWQYSNGGAALFSGIIQSATGKTAEEYANKVLFPEIGFQYDYWESDRAGHSTTAWGIYTTVRQFAKFGYLYLNNGNWDGNQVVSQNYVALSRQPVSAAVNWYGFMWWLKPSLENWENSVVPDNLMIAWGKYTQQIFVMPDQHLLVLRFGNDPYSTNDQWDETTFLTKILAAIQE
ncbi:MAG: serine hydrolase [Acidobacteria bacterium]|nr:serine hydrolase [Acidobacteriota bacterium]